MGDLQVLAPGNFYGLVKALCMSLNFSPSPTIQHIQRTGLDGFAMLRISDPVYCVRPHFVQLIKPASEASHVAVTHFSGEKTEVREGDTWPAQAPLSSELPALPLLSPGSSFLPGVGCEEFSLCCIFSLLISSCLLQQPLAKDPVESTTAALGGGLIHPRAISPHQGLELPSGKPQLGGPTSSPAQPEQPASIRPPTSKEKLLCLPASWDPVLHAVTQRPWLVWYLVSTAKHNLPGVSGFFFPACTKHVSVLINGSMVWCSHPWPSILCLRMVPRIRGRVTGRWGQRTAKQHCRVRHIAPVLTLLLSSKQACKDLGSHTHS